MLPTALEYPLGDSNGFRVYRPARGGRSCEHFGGYKTKPNTFIMDFLVCISIDGSVYMVLGIFHRDPSCFNPYVAGW